MNTPGGVRNFKLVFTVDGEKLTGTVKRAAGDVPLVGTIKGSDLQFAYSIKYGDGDLTISMTGKVDGDSISGTVSFGESGQQDEWSAKRIVEQGTETPGRVATHTANKTRNLKGRLNL